ncbi:unnamed protein product [Penicillium palitans]
MSAISIQKGPIQLAGLLFTPTTASDKTPALIIVHPGGGVKEQTAQVYAKNLLRMVCYDASHQGESGGEPRFLEDPNERVTDVYAVIDYLQKDESVDAEKIGVVGICAGGGYAVAATKADHRLKAVATISMVNIGDSARLGWYGDEESGKNIKLLEQAAAQITAETRGKERAVAPYVPPQLDDNTPYDLKEAHNYYLGPRAQHPRAKNTMLFLSFPRVVTFDAFHLAETFLTQPALLIAGENAGSLWHTEKLHKILDGKAKKVILSKGTHMDLYDKEEFVEPAVKSVAEFMQVNL